jgi:hypothetical protein
MSLSKSKYWYQNNCLHFQRRTFPLGFNFSNRITETLESSSILIHLIQVKGIYARQNILIKTRVLIIRNTKEGIIAKLIKMNLIWGEGEEARCEFNLRTASH